MTATFAPLAALFAVDSLSLLSPGPNMLLLTQAGAARGRRHALLVALGLAIGGLAWAGAALGGLAALFRWMPGLQVAIRIGGGAYLLYLATRLWRARGAADAAPPHAAADERPALRIFLQGLGTSALNPKALAYFASVFVVLVPAEAPASLHAAAAALVFVDALAWYGLAALLFSSPRVAQGYRALRRPIDRACAGLLAVFGLKLIF